MPYAQTASLAFTVASNDFELAIDGQVVLAGRIPALAALKETLVEQFST